MKLKKVYWSWSKYNTTPEFNMLTAENVAARLAQAYLSTKSDIVNFVQKLYFDC